LAAAAIAARHQARFILPTSYPERFEKLRRGIAFVLEKTISAESLLEAIAKLMS
jgi:hypothetical protein